MMNDAIKNGSKLTTRTGKSYTAVAEPKQIGGVWFVSVEPTEENDWTRRIELRSVATTG